MANTFTNNYDFVKSEIGGDNASWGTNLHTSLDNADTALAKKLEDQLISGITSTAILLSKDNSSNTISTDANLKYFESVKVGDRIRVSGSTDAASGVNGTAAIPAIHTVTAKTSANSITVNNNLTQDIESSHTVAKVLEPIHIDSGPIVCAPLTSLSQTTRAVSGCVGQPGSGDNKDTTDALVANGNVTLGSANTDTVSFTSKVDTDILPSAAGLDLGATGTGNEWEDLWIDGTANIDSLVADTAAISGGSITGGTGKFTTLAVGTGVAPSDGATINMTGYTIGTNGKGTRTVSGNSPSGSGHVNGDIWFEVA